jgi:hypothetical protein
MMRLSYAGTNSYIAGNLGVGSNTSPSGKLHVASTAVNGYTYNSGFTQIIAEGNSTAGISVAAGTAATGGLVFANSNGGSDGYLVYDNATRNMILATAGSERMRINSSGYITTPSQPKFFARKTTSTALSSTEVQLIYDTVTFNIGSCYNASNGRFTAPVTGVYQFNITNSFTSSNNNVYNAVYPWVNGSSSTYNWVRLRGTTVNGAYGGINGSMTIALTAGDYLQLTAYSQFTGVSLSSDETTFSGFLIG